MNKSKIITFILIGNNDDKLEKEIVDMDRLIHYGNAITLRGSHKFKMLFENMKDDCEFRLIVHYGLREDAKSIGRKIEADINSSYNIHLEFFTREPSIFTEINDLSVLYSPESSNNKIKLYNFDQMNTEYFIDNLPIIQKHTTLKSDKIRTDKVNPQKPKIFIGSSTEGLNIARKVKKGLKFDAHVETWAEGIFDKPSQTYIEILENAVLQYNYGIFVFTPDDKIYSRGKESNIPRDNVIFEYGMFLGKHTRNKVFFIKPRGVDIKIMTDMLGVTSLDYDPTHENLTAAVGDACEEIREIIENN